MLGSQGSVCTSNRKYSTQIRQPILHLHRLLSITAPFSLSTRAKIDARKKVLCSYAHHGAPQPSLPTWRYAVRGGRAHIHVCQMSPPRGKRPPRRSPCLGWHTERRPRPGITALFTRRVALVASPSSGEDAPSSWVGGVSGPPLFFQGPGSGQEEAEAEEQKQKEQERSSEYGFPGNWTVPGRRVGQGASDQRLGTGTRTGSPMQLGKCQVPV